MPATAEPTPTMAAESVVAAVTAAGLATRARHTALASDDHRGQHGHGLTDQVRPLL